tara:strand:+ start:1995 stop:3368 length:1374 start_codon:yes stop_codon:yes gene_type:complete
MGGGLMQLVAYGAQDIYLTGNPQITFFKVVYRRHTNFAMEAIPQTFNGEITANSSTVTSVISRNGDLVGRMWLDCVINSSGFSSEEDGHFGTTGTYNNWTNNTGHAFVKECEVEIGGQRIDLLNSQWLDIWNELTDHDESEWMGLNKHSAKGSYLKLMKANQLTPVNNLQIYVPLPFWFSRNVGLALPLIALQSHEVKVKLTTRSILSLINSDYTVILSHAITDNPVVTLWCDYIYLDTDERRRFAQVSHEYLIEQIQMESISFKNNMQKPLNFDHPVKELIWVIQNENAAKVASGWDTIGKHADAYVNTCATNNVITGDKWKNNDYFNYGVGYATSSKSNDKEIIAGVEHLEPFDNMKLQLNGQDRFEERKASYFRLCQPFQAGHKVPSKHIYCYSFALKPEEHQPSGTCNFTRLDSAKMIFKNLDPGYKSKLTVYAINYNILRIMSGMGGLAYSS